MIYSSNILIKITIISLIFLTNNVCNAKNNFNIENIRTIELKTIKYNDIFSYLPLKEYQILKNKKTNNTIKTLFINNISNNIEILKDKDNIFIEIQDKPIIYDVVFYGNQEIKIEILEEYCKMFHLTQGELFNEIMIHKLKAIIENYYINIGKFNIKIKIIVKKLIKNRVKLFFIINEGNFYKVKKINIIGNKNFTKRKILSLINLDKINIFLRLYKYPICNSNFIRDNLEKIKDFYLSSGYAFFNIDYKTNLMHDLEEVIIDIFIKEGSKYYIDKIDLELSFKKTYPEIKKIINEFHKQIYNYKEIENIKNKIQSILYEDGYADNTIKIIEDINEKQKNISLKFKIEKKEKIYVNRINIIGNFKTRDLTIRRNIIQQEQSIFNRNLILSDKKNLIKLEYFENIDIEIERLPFYKNKVNLIYKVKEKDFGNVSFSIGINNERRINFKMNFKENNLFGTGKLLNINAIKNSNTSYSEITFMYPYLFNRNLNGTHEILYKNSNNSEYSGNYDLIKSSISNYLTLPFNKKYFIIGLKYENNNIKYLKKQITIDRYLNSIKKLKEVKYKIKKFITTDLFLFLGYRYESLDDHYLPNKGSKFEINNKITIPKSDNQYHKTTVEYRKYLDFKLIKKIIIMIKCKMGVAHGFNSKLTPFYDYYNADNDNNIRGFESNTIGPKYLYFKKQKNDKNKLSEYKNSIGGDRLFINSLEIIFTELINKKYSKLVRPSIFLDTGVIWDNNWKKIKNIPNYNKFNRIRISSGISLRYLSPIGPITISYSKIMKKFSNDKLENFQFNIGLD